MLSSPHPAKTTDAEIDTHVTNKPKYEYIEIAIIKYDSGFGREADISETQTLIRINN